MSDPDERYVERMVAAWEVIVTEIMKRAVNEDGVYDVSDVPGYEVVERKI